MRGEGDVVVDRLARDAASISLVDDKAKSSMQVHVGKADKGSDIMIAVTREGGAAPRGRGDA